MEREYKGIEKRKYKRIERTFFSRIRTYPWGREDRPSSWDIVTLCNLSAGGALFSYNHEIKIDTFLNLLISFPGFSEPIKCNAQTIRAEGYNRLRRVAVFFTDIDAEKKDTINNIAENMYYKNLLKLSGEQERNILWSRYKMQTYLSTETIK